MARPYGVLPPRWVLAAFSAVVIILFSGQSQTAIEAQAAIAFVQVNSATPQTASTTVAVPYRSAQSAGNLNVVVIGWNDTTAQVQAVADTQGNTYVRAVGPTIRSGLGTQSIYYAANIAAASANANVVTVTFAPAAQFADIRIAEYRGVAQSSPVDGAIGAQGSGTTSSSGTVTTTNPNDLIVGANLVAERTTAAGTGFTNRVITSPDGDILEDRIVTAAGANSATARLTGGAWVMQMVAFRAGEAPADTESPSVPGNLQATASSANQVTLTWIASTDNVGVSGYRIERCQSAGCSNFVQIGTSTVPNYVDASVVGSTAYNYRVRANDAAGNASGYSAVAPVTTPAAPDTQAPSAPSGLTATPTSSTRIDLSWNASTDNVGVSGYLIERCIGSGCASFAQIAAASPTTYTDAALDPGTVYRYRVRATDAAGNLGSYSAIASATTPALPDSQAPTAPTGLIAVAASSSQINLTWSASSDDVGVTAYLIERCQGAPCANFVQIGSSSSATYSDTTGTASTQYNYRVRATDAAANSSGYSNVASVTTLAAAAIAFVQMNYATPQTSQSSVTVGYPAAQSAGNLNVVVVGWNDTTAQVQSVTDARGNAYVRAVGPTARSGLGTQSIYYASNIANADAGTNLVTVRFSPAAKNADIRIAEYQGVSSANPVDGTAAASGSGTTSNSGSVTTANAADLLVAANLVATTTTAAGSGFTTRVITVPDGDILEDRTVTTVGSYNATAANTNGGWVMQLVAFRAGVSAPDTQPPTTPTSLVATSSSSSASLTWTASTDNVAVANYLVERCEGPGCSTFAQIGTSSAPTFTDSTTAPATSYTYRVRAVDSAGNVGGYSNTATCDIPAPDSEPPSVPGSLTATAISGSQINLTWLPASDNIGVTGYRVERCQGAGCSIFVKLGTPTGPSYLDTGLTPNTSYTYVVLATDAAGNLGPASNPATALTGVTMPELVAAFSFNEGTGPTTFDTSGTGNHGSIGSATWTTAGKYGSALAFNGGARVIVPDSPSLHLTSGLALEAWVNPSSVSVGWRDVIYKGNDNYFLEATTSNAGRPSAGITVGSVNNNTYGPSVLPTNTWSHLAETYDGSAVRLYVNGVQVATTTIAGIAMTSTNPLEIGGDGIFGQYFQGLIDELRVYNVARTPTQIQSDMTSPIGASVPLVTLSRSSIDYGQEATGVTSSPTEVIVTNVGSAPLTIAGISITSTGATDFGQTNDCGSSVAVGASCSILVTFTPSASVARTATLIIQDDAADAPHAIAVQGIGVPVQVSPSTATVTTGSTQQFVAVTSGSSSFVWLIDGVTGGSPASGTITTQGLYTAPPLAGAHTVTAATVDQLQSGTATIFVVSSTGVVTYHNDNARTGANLAETVLTPGNVNATRFGKLRAYALDGVAMASPLYVPAVAIPGQGVRNVVYVATEHDSMYAFDADGVATTPFWQVSFINPAAGITTVNPADTGECCDITPEIGITGTPVVDATSGTLYVVAKTKEVSGGNTSYVQRLHALDISSGAEKFGGPVVIQAMVPGTGAGSSGGQVSFVPLRENQRPALLLNNGVVYIAFGSHGDQQPYHGWVLGYTAETLQQTFAYCVTPNGEGGGVWLANAGLSADAAGNIYFATGDGTFDANQGGANFGDSYIKLSRSGALLDYFTPHNEATLDGGNIDLGAGGVLLLPDQAGAHTHLLVSAGKNGTIDLIDRDNMGHYNPANDNQIVQSLVNVFPFGTPEPGNYSAPVYFNGTVYFSPVADSIQAFALTDGRLSTSPVSRSPEVLAYPGGTLAISADGATNGILWALERRAGSAGALHAYNASNLANELYHSDQAGSRDALDEVVKFSAPVIASGKVVVASATKLYIFGLFQ